jgi:hypothetical protein
MQISGTQVGASATMLAKNATFINFQALSVSGSTLVFTTEDNNAITDSYLWAGKVGTANQNLGPLYIFDTFGPFRGSSIALNGTTAYVLVDPQNADGTLQTTTSLYACSFTTANSCTRLVSISTSCSNGTVLSGNNVFFDDCTGNAVWEWLLSSADANGTFVSPPPVAAGIMAADSSRIYFAYNADGTKQTVTTEGIVNTATNGKAVAEGFANTTGQATGLASDGKFLYFAWVNSSGASPTGSIQYAPVAGGVVGTLYTGSQPRAVVTANGGIYWIDGTNIYGQRFP